MYISDFDLFISSPSIDTKYLYDPATMEWAASF